MKHAIMIMAHTDWDSLKHLIQLYDNTIIDFIIHINSRSRSWSDDIIDGITKESSIYLAPRQNVSYCNYSQVDAMVSLLKTALQHGPYDYYHLISGADLPIHPISTFLNFFAQESNKQFIGFSNNYRPQQAGHRSFFSNSIRTSKGFRQKALIYINKVLQNLQFLLKINVAKSFHGTPMKGADWWSVTDKAARLLVEEEPTFRKYFNHTYCPSELFAQTILYNSSLSDTIIKTNDECKGSLREIDWTRGQPYVWRKTDFEYLINSKCMFARKFDKNIDSEIIQLISNHVKQ